MQNSEKKISDVEIKKIAKQKAKEIKEIIESNSLCMLSDGAYSQGFGDGFYSGFIKGYEIANGESINEV